MADKDFKVKRGIEVGANAAIEGAITSVDSIQFDLTANVELPAQGQFAWSEDDATVSLGLGTATLQLGQEQFLLVKNQSGNTIGNGNTVMFAGTVGSSGRILGQKGLADGSVPSKYFIGLATQNIADGEAGYVTTFGKLRGVDTSMFSEGDILFAHPSIPGALSNSAPAAPNNKVVLAAVVSSDAANGSLFTRLSFADKLVDLQDVYAPVLSDAKVLAWSAANARFEARTVSSGGGGEGGGTIISPTEPPDPTLGLLWYNTTNDLLYAYMSTGWKFISVSETIVYPDENGEASFTSPGTYSWVPPAGVNFVHVVCVGGGGGATSSGTSGSGAGGGGLGWKNDIPVTPGVSYTVVVGDGGTGSSTTTATDGGTSYFISANTVSGSGGGRSASTTSAGTGGGFTGDGGGNGGPGGTSTSAIQPGGGGGAGGYTGAGGSGSASVSAGSAGAGGAGGGGGGGGSANGAGAGGGVGLLGAGTSGAGGAGGTSGGTRGDGGSGGTGGGVGNQTGGFYGGGGGGGDIVATPGGGSGAVRIIWGPARAFPSTNTGAL
jgi:hypothetical protein